MAKMVESISKWVTVPCKFWVSASSQDALEEAVRRIPKEVWLDTVIGGNMGSFSILSEKAKKK